MTRAALGALAALIVALAAPAGADPEALTRARELSWTGRYDASLALYRELVAERPDDLGLQREMGNVLLWAGRYEAALAHFERVLAAEPLDKEMRLAAGRALWYLGRPRQAAGHYLLALEGPDPDPAQIAEAVAVLRAAERPALAARWLRRGLARDPRHPDLRAVRADAWIAAGELDRAERELEAVRAEHPEHDGAAERLEALRRERRDPVALARRIGNQDDLRRALRLLRGHLERNPDDTEARRLLARFAAFAGDYDASEAAYAELLAAAPDDRELRTELAETLSWRGSYARSRRILAALVRDDPRDLRARLGIANIDLWSERHRSADRELHEILALEPEHAGAREQLRRLRQLRAPRVEPDLRWFRDSDDFELLTSQTRVSISPLAGRVLSLVIDATRAEGRARDGVDPQTGAPRLTRRWVDGQGLRLAWHERPEGQLGFGAELGVARYASDAVAPRARLFVDWFPRDGHLLELDLRHEDALGAVRSLESALEDVERSSAFLVHSYRGERLDAWTRLELARFSDDRNLYAARTVIGYAVMRWPVSVDLLLLGSASDVSRVSPSYYSPQDETSYAAGLRVKKRLLGRLDVLLIGEYGRMRNRDGSGERLRVAPELSLEIGESLALSLRYDHFESIRASSYRSDFAFAQLRYRFPVTP